MYKQIAFCSILSVSVLGLSSCSEAKSLPELLCEVATSKFLPRPEQFNVLQSVDLENKISLKFEVSAGGSVGYSTCEFSNIDDIRELELTAFSITGFEDSARLLQLARMSVFLEKIEHY